MTTKARLNKFYKKTLKALQNYYREFNAEADPKKLHQIRVEYKKLNALLFFLQKCNGVKSARAHVRRIRKVFKHAGIIRSAQLNLQLIKRYRIPCPELTLQLEMTRKEETEGFLAAEQEYSALIKKTRKQQVPDFNRIKDKCILSIYRQQVKKLVLFFKGVGQEGNLHSCRKKIKMLIYLHEGLDQELTGKLRLNTVYFDKLQDTIGKWHDAFVTVELLINKGYADEKFTGKPLKEMQKKFRTISSMTSRIHDKAFLNPDEINEKISSQSKNPGSIRTSV